MALDESKNDNKNPIQINDIKILVDKETEDSIGTTVPLTIDYFKTPVNEGFTINNGRC